MLDSIADVPAARPPPPSAVPPPIEASTRSLPTPPRQRPFVGYGSLVSPLSHPTGTHPAADHPTAGHPAAGHLAAFTAASNLPAFGVGAVGLGGYPPHVAFGAGLFGYPYGFGPAAAFGYPHLPGVPLAAASHQTGDQVALIAAAAAAAAVANPAAFTAAFRAARVAMPATAPPAPSPPEAPPPAVVDVDVPTPAGSVLDFLLFVTVDYL